MTGAREFRCDVELIRRLEQDMTTQAPSEEDDTLQSELRPRREFWRV